eukprot:TRINITY_DN13457_c0_g4_i1.p1 TRINITY_DN13457_c0_g4~~TRINITY_DN13457_c0_g4_i1.p1  ORF type:complete len:1213 (+),score=589.56 TRINITY_DN13457_c0_g4_i1:93-3641(+)
MVGKIEGKLDLTEQTNKQYRAPRVGKSAEKKKAEDKKKRGLGTEQLNSKAFATGRPGTRQKAIQKLDRSQHNAHVPKEDKTFADVFNEPPETVAVVGPPGSGKTTLIRSLVKQFTKQNLTSVKGPVTCIAGKQRRITFFECPNDVHAMCDIARVADLVLLVVDASFGFEMETFEFLNISKSHGFPKLIGVLTHLDKLKDNKQLKKTKKALRHRFWQEICNGAKLFYLSGIDKNLYPAKEIINLNRFIAVTKLVPQNWRTTHSCVLADRMEDVTDPAQQQQNPGCDRKIALYGYVRGCPLKGNQRVHIPGVGDYTITSCHHLDDPCALPQRGNKKKTRHLSERDKRLYAPMADVGSLMYDADAIYIREEKPDDGFVHQGEGVSIMSRFKEDTLKAKTVDESLRGTKISLFEGGEAVDGEGEDEAFDPSTDMPEHLKATRYSETPVYDDSGRLRRRVTFAQDQVVGALEGDEEDDDISSDDEDPNNASNKIVLSSARRDEVTHSLTDTDLKGLTADDEDDDDIFYKVGQSSSSIQQKARDMSHFDTTRDIRGILEDDWEVETVREGIRDLFVTGNWTEEESRGDNLKDSAAHHSLVKGGGAAPKASVLGKRKASQLEAKGYESVSEGEDDDEMDEMDYQLADEEGEEDEEDEEDEEVDADMEGASGEEGEEGAAPSKKKSQLEEMRDSVKGMIPTALLTTAPQQPEPEADDAAQDDEHLSEREKNMKKKAAKKKAFDEMYDQNKAEGGGKDFLDKMKDTLEEKKERTNRHIEEVTGGNVEEKIKQVGYYAGLYVRVVVEGVPAEFVRNFNPKHPLIAGGLLASEDRLGVVYIRLKKHRWYPKLLKAQDPLVLAVGWRRFQTQPLFAVEDPNGRNRYLKYTPLHTHCIAAVYGPVTPPNTGVICFTNAALKADINHFRCSATGYVMEVDHSSRIVKKLKLTGVPAKVYKNTAFVKNMFSSALEVAKFEGAKVQTVSGLRGTVKKAVAGKGGVYRATFEDKIAKSDIVFLKTWKAVEPNKYYNPVTNMLLDEWKGMRSMTELRRDNHIAVPYSKDSIYREQTRTKQFNTTLKVPAALEGSALPYDQRKLRFTEKQGQSKLDKAVAGETGFVLDPEAQKTRDVLEKLSLMDNIKKRSEKENRALKLAAYKKKLQLKADKSSVRLKELKKKNARLADFKEQRAKRARK